MTVIGLDRNELPYDPTASAVVGAAQELLESRRYPSWDAHDLRQELARRFGVQPDWVVAASGSVNVIQQAVLAAGPGDMIFSWPSVDAFPGLASALRMRLRLADVRSDGSCDLADMRAKITQRTHLIIVCTPNTPTGGALRHRELAKFLADIPTSVLVVVDEAYAEFVDMDDPLRAIDLVRSHSNVMMTRTFSKAYGLAGLRVGYGIAQPRLASAIRQAGVPYPLSRPAEIAAIKALRDADYMLANVKKVIAERARLATGLRELGMRVMSGHGNFVWVPIAGDTAPIVHDLSAAGMQVKAYPSWGIRVTVGTSEQTEQLLRVWPKSLAHCHAQDQP